jgi:hypothetical protein
MLAAAIWLWVAPDRIYHCSDDVGPIAPYEWLTPGILRNPFGLFHMILFASPRFVHAGMKMGENNVDHYIWPAPLVWLIWLGFVAGAFLLPVLILPLCSRLWQMYQSRRQ